MLAKDVVRSDFVKIDKEDTISSLIGKLRLSKKTEAVVLDGKRYAGVVCKKKLIKSRMRVHEEKIRRVVAKPAVLNGGEDIKKVAKLMNASDIHMLPLVKKGIVEGVVYAIDVVKQLDASAKEKRISDILRQEIIAFDENTPVGNIINVMHLRKISRAPIVNEQSKLVGIVSVVDLLLRYSIFPARRPGGKNIREAKSSPGKERDLVCLPIINECTTEVVTASSKERIKTVILLMEKNNISDVVIVDEYNEPTGIITIKDLLKLFS